MYIILEFIIAVMLVFSFRLTNEGKKMKIKIKN